MTQGEKTSKTEATRSDVAPELQPFVSTDETQALNPSQLNQPQPNVELPTGDSQDIELQDFNVSAENFPHVRQQTQNPAENLSKEIKNVDLAGDEDAIQDISGPASLVGSTSSASVVRKINKSKCEVLKDIVCFPWKQFKRKIIANLLSLLADIIFITLKIKLESNYSDVFMAMTITSGICLVFTLVCKKGCLFFYLKKKNFKYCLPWFARFKSESEYSTRQSHYVPSEEITSFEHEVVDTSNINPNDLPKMPSRHQESLDSLVTDQLLEPSMEVAVDVHSDVYSSPHFSGGACGYTSPESAAEGRY